MTWTPDTPTWVRSGRLGNPEALEEAMGLLRQVRDYLQVLDPLAQGLAYVAEIEARLVQIFQLLSTPRTLGLVLAEALLSWLRPYLTDGAYVIQHGNLREFFERVGVSHFLRGFEAFVGQMSLRNRADQPGQQQSLLQFGPSASRGQQGALSGYTSYPQVVRGQFDLYRRETARAALDLFNTQPFDAFGDWLAPILAAFYDPADADRPVAGPADKLGAFFFAVEGQDPVAVLDAYEKLLEIFGILATDTLDFEGILNGLEEDFGIDTLRQWSLRDSLQWMGVKSSLRPVLVQRYGTSPDFERVSTADLLPFLGNLLLDLSNLADFAGFPFPENLALTSAAERLAQKIRQILKSFDRALDLLTKLVDLLDLFGVWRLHLPPQTGGVEGLVARIEAAPRDDTVRIFTGTAQSSTASDGAPRLTEYVYGRISQLPEDPDVPGYDGQQVGDWLLSGELEDLGQAFADADREGFEYSDPKVIRAGELMRKSHAQALQRVFPSLSFGPPGDLLIAGIGLVVVEGPLYRLLAALFGPSEGDWAQWLGDGPEASPDREVLEEALTFRSVLSQPHLTPSGPSSLPDGVAPMPVTEVPAALDMERGSPGVPLRQSVHGVGRTVSGSQARSVLSTSAQGPRQCWLAGTRLDLLCGPSRPLPATAHHWSGSAQRMLPASVGARLPQAPVPEGSEVGATEFVPSWSYAVGEAATLPAFFPHGPVTLGDVTIEPGGAVIRSPSFQALLDIRGFQEDTPVRWILDVRVAKAGRSCWLRTVAEEGLDPLLGRIRVFPALPSPPEIDSASPQACRLYGGDWPSLEISPGSWGASPAGGGTTFSLCAQWRKSAERSAESLALEGLASLMGHSAGHLQAEGESLGWGSYTKVQIVPPTQHLSGGHNRVSSGTVDQDPTDVFAPHYPQGQATLRGEVSPAAEPQVVPYDRSASWAQMSQTTLLSQGSTETLWAPPTALLPLDQLWRPFHVAVPARRALGLGSTPDNPVAVYAPPSLWLAILEETQDGDLITHSLGSALADIPTEAEPDRIAGWSRAAWSVTFDPDFIADFEGQGLWLLLSTDYAQIAALEVDFGALRPSARWCPWIFAPGADVPLVGEFVTISPPSHAREGLLPRGASLFGGSDSAWSGACALQAVPSGAGTSRRSQGVRRSAGVALEFVMGVASSGMRGTWLLLQGQRHRILWEARDAGVRLTLQYAGTDLGNPAVSVTQPPAWSTLLTVNVPHTPAESYVAVVADVLPTLTRVDLLMATRATLEDDWEVAGSAQSLEASEAACYPLGGCRDLAGAWRIGAEPRRSVLQAPALNPWGALAEPSGVLPGFPPAGFVALRFQGLRVDEPDALLAQYGGGS